EAGIWRLPCQARKAFLTLKRQRRVRRELKRVLVLETHAVVSAKLPRSGGDANRRNKPVFGYFQADRIGFRCTLQRTNRVGAALESEVAGKRSASLGGQLVIARVTVAGFHRDVHRVKRPRRLAPQQVFPGGDVQQVDPTGRVGTTIRSILVADRLPPSSWRFRGAILKLGSCNRLTIAEHANRDGPRL